MAGEKQSSGTKCLSCNRQLTWLDQKQQFGRAINKYGLSVEEAKKITPRCGKCLTELYGTSRAAVHARKLKSWGAR